MRQRRGCKSRVAQYAMVVLLAVFCVSLVSARSASVDPLPSWNNGPAKSAILAFVNKVTQAGGSEFVPIPERIATFDNDGTLCVLIG